MIVSVSKKTSALRRALVVGSGAACVTVGASPMAVGVAWGAGRDQGMVCLPVISIVGLVTGLVLGLRG